MERVIINFPLVQLTSNQLLVLGNLEDLFPSSPGLDIIITLSYCHQFCSMVVKVNLEDLGFLLVDDDFNPGDLPSWIEHVTII